MQSAVRTLRRHVRARVAVFGAGAERGRRHHRHRLVAESGDSFQPFQSPDSFAFALAVDGVCPTGGEKKVAGESLAAGVKEMS